jgi:hypothetical protein
VESEAGAAALEEKVNAILPLAPSKDEQQQGATPSASVATAAPAPPATTSAVTEMQMS